MSLFIARKLKAKVGRLRFSHLGFDKLHLVYWSYVLKVANALEAARKIYRLFYGETLVW